MKATQNHNFGMFFPELAKEWHQSRNGSLKPSEVAPNSSKKVWWRCEHGHEWQSIISNRAKGRGCPKCYNKRRSSLIKKVLLKKRGSLAEKYPELIKQWHPTKNGTLTPNNITARSHTKVWWICNNGHEYPSIISNRSRGWGCPYCANKKISNYNNFAVKYPEIAKQWHSSRNDKLTPQELAPTSSRIVWWICKRGHEWKASVNNRVTHESGCPKCHPKTSKLEIRIYCEFKKIFDEVLYQAKIGKTEIDIYIPQYKIAIEVDGYPWHKGREINDIQKGKILLEKGILLFHLRDNKLKQISQTDVFYKITNKHNIPLKKLLEKLLITTILTTEHREKILNYISLNIFQNNDEYKTLLSFLPAPMPEKSFAKLFPKIAEEWNYEKNRPLKPDMFTSGSTINVWWKCKKGHEWSAVLYSRTNGTNCPYCSGKKPTIENNLAVNNPELAKEWHFIKNGELTPNQVTPKSGKKVWWICKQGHEWQSSIAHRNNGRGCPKCRWKKKI